MTTLLALAALTPPEGFTMEGELGVGEYSVRTYTLDDTLNPQSRLLVVRGDSVVVTLGDSSFPNVIVDPLTGTDLDGDSAADLVVTLVGSDECAECLRLKVLSLRPDGVVRARLDLPPWAEPVSFEDVNGDGTFELVALDTALSTDLGLCSGCVGGVRVLLIRNDGAYTRKGLYWPQFYEPLLKRAKKKLEKADRADKKTALLAYVALLFYAGNPDAAYDEFHENYDDDDWREMWKRVKVTFMSR